jgi:AraC family transcriptional regulator
MERRILRVTDYIFDHPAGDLSLTALADVAAMSPHHWHRVFHAMTGETLASAVRRIRLQRASQILVQENCPIAEVARRVGYPNTASFSRAFTARFGLAPREFRQRGVGGSGNPRFRAPAQLTHSVEIRDLPAVRLAAVAHKGDYNRIDRAFETVLSLFAGRGLMPAVRGVIGVFYDDPSAKPFRELTSHAAFVVDASVPVEPPLEDLRLPGGRHAVMTVVGPFSGLAEAWDQMFGAWLPASGEEPADTPAHIAYLSDAATTPPAELVNEIRLPLKGR